MRHHVHVRLRHPAHLAVHAGDRIVAVNGFSEDAQAGAQGPRGPGAQGPRGPGAQGPRGPGAQGPRGPGAQGRGKLPSGNLLHSYGKWPFIVEFPIENDDGIIIPFGNLLHSYGKIHHF